MIELPDDELDKLFRKSSEELDPQFDPEDWNSLKKRLDAHDGKTAGGWLKKWWPIAMLALLIPVGFAVYFFTKNPVSESKKAVQSTKHTGPISTQSEETATPVVPGNKTEEYVPGNVPSASPLAARDEKPVSSESAAVDAKSLKSNIKPGITTRNKDRNRKSSSESNIANYQSRKTLPRSQSKTGGVYLEPNRSKQEGGDGAFSFHKTNVGQPGDRPVSENKAAAEDIAESASGQEPSENEGRLLISAETLASRILHWNNQPETPAVTFNALEVSEEPVAGEKPVEGYAKWAVRLGYSPDLSTVGFKNYTKPGAAFSLLVEYGLSSRLYLQTGVVRSEKDYSANAGEYKLYDYVTKINTPYAVDGQCTMFEIPLGLRYNVIQMPQSKLFAGAGVSSYYAQKEQYKYHYAKYVYDQKPGWKGKTGWFLLSHINASIGYERTITKKLSLVAEPYIRIPVKGVGYGKVNLMTIGTWISLRYTPAFK